MGNKKDGIHLQFSLNALVKHNLVVGNLNGIAYRDPVTGQPVMMTRGVDIKEIVLAAVGNKIVSNSIFDNCKRGIMLGTKCEDTELNLKRETCGPNRLQNHPVIRAVIKNDCDTLIKGALSSVPCTDFLVQLFNNTKNRKKDCVTEGKTLIDEFTVHTDRGGFATFERSVKCPVEFVSATATRCDTSDTSEFSKNKEVVMSY